MNFVAEEHNVPPIYRPDIDGLRAVAILSVVIFHAFPFNLRGGFVGVDVFFVISGFLISTIIFRSLQRGDFRFGEFYAHRIRRIFPALVIVLVACYIFGWFTLLPDEFKQLGKHMAAGAGFVQNYILWKEVGYFDTASELKPLLHLWSLAIEEQFYLIYPVFIFSAWRIGLNVLTLILVLGVISFGLNISGVAANPTETFFVPQTRFWELLTGAILAYLQFFKKVKLSGWMQYWVFHPILFRHPPQPARRSEVLNNILSIVGLSLLATALFFITKGRAFPGWWALFPVSGAFFLILAGPEAWGNRVILANRLMVFFGLISYPLYLWHWPILSFARIIESETPSPEIRLGAVALSFLLAWITYILIEKPIRFGKSTRTKTIGLIIAIVVVGYMGYNAFLREGLSFRKNSSPIPMATGDIGHLDFHEYPAKKFFPCTPNNIANEALKWEGYIRCLQSQDNENVEIALIGDSHAEHLFIGLAEKIQNRNIVFYIKANVPFIDNEDFSTIFKHVLSSKTIKIVILNMAWAGRISQVPKGSSLDAEILKTASALIQSGKDVFITDDVPWFPYDAKKCAFRRVLSSTHTCLVDRDIVDKASALYVPSLNKVVAREPRVKLINTLQYFCDKKQCRMSNKDALLYRDSSHLNINGSRYLATRILEDYPEISK